MGEHESARRFYGSYVRKRLKSKTMRSWFWVSGCSNVEKKKRKSLDFAMQLLCYASNATLALATSRVQPGGGFLRL